MSAIIYNVYCPLWVPRLRKGPVLILAGRKNRPLGRKDNNLFGYCKFIMVTISLYLADTIFMNKLGVIEHIGTNVI